MTVSIFKANDYKFLGLKNIHWYQLLAKLLLCGTKTPNSKKRSKETIMFGLGSTITATHWPRFLCDGTAHILPRPYRKCKPHNIGWKLMQQYWFRKLTAVLENLVFQYLETIEKTKHTSQVLSDLKEIKSIVPESLRIAKTIFTQLTITTSTGKKNMEAHIDDGDIICAVLHLGDVTNGGSTLYFKGSECAEIRKETYSVNFEHGRIQIGFFDKVYHCALSFEGFRYALNFNSKKNVLKHFQLYGSKYYDQLVDNNYETNHFLAR